MENTMNDKIELTLSPAPVDPFFENSGTAAAGTPGMPVPAEAAGLPAEKPLTAILLTPEEEAQVAEFARQIDISDSNAVLRYGAASQQKIAAFSDTALEGVKTKDLGEIGDMITDLVAELKEDPSRSKGFLGLFRFPASLKKIRASYAAARQNVDRISSKLAGHQNLLIRDSAMLDELYKTNLSYYKELTMYILAGKQALEEAKNVKLPELKAKAQKSGLPEDAQAVSDFENMIVRFEKKLYDLELTRNIAMQMAPQIRLIQSNDVSMAEKIQSTIVNTIPLWKNQMVLALSLAHSEEALEAERSVTDMTNELLKKNAETLKQGTVDIAKESERAVVDLETLRETNRKLIESLTEVAKIQEEGRLKRAEAENELNVIENELRQKLLELSTGKE